MKEEINKVVSLSGLKQEDFNKLKKWKEEGQKINQNDFKTFAFFSVLTVLTTRYLLKRFKRKLVGDSPFTVS